jgi:small subunit ribosomal protein S6e
MTFMKFVINDTTTSKSYQKEIDDTKVMTLNGMKIGDTFDGGIIDLPGYKLEIRGGTDRDGFSMRVHLQGVAKKGVLIKTNPKSKGVRIRKTFRGNTVGSHIAQLNVKPVKIGAKGLKDIFEAPVEEKAE